MSRRKDEIRLRHMVEASQKAVHFINGRGRDDLDADEMLGMALVRLLEIVGEAAKNVTDERRSSAPGIPWRAIAGTRDRLVHAYFDVDLDIVWEIVSVDLPALIPELERLLDDLTSD